MQTERLFSLIFPKNKSNFDPSFVYVFKHLIKDKFLFLILLLSFLLSIYGINWGRAEDWNPDQRVFNIIYPSNILDFKGYNPGWFLKPPFHTYFNYLLSVWPINFWGSILGISFSTIQKITLIWSRTLTIFLFISSTVVIYRIIKKWYGKFVARIISLIFATSAGLIAHNHFLTADIPVMFWILLSFYYSQKLYTTKASKDYFLSGFFTGIATATKYNGLIAGSAFVTFHFLAHFHDKLPSIFLKKKFLMGLGAILLGFFLANPFAIFDHKTFFSDFYYLLVTEKYYGTLHSGYLIFWSKIPELIGYPAFWLFIIGFTISLKIFIKHSGNNAVFIGCLSIIIPYYIFFAANDHIPARFVLPIIPYFLMLSGSFWEKTEKRVFFKNLVICILFTVAIYNLISSYYVGKRFVNDPRMKAQIWVKNNLPKKATVEISDHVPDWNMANETDLTLIKMPNITDRSKRFLNLFKDNKLMQEKVKRNEGKADIAWFSPLNLAKRSPDFIFLDSLYYAGLIEEFPSIGNFINNLFDEKLGYKVIFDQEAQSPPNWVYPQYIDFINNRLTIFGKN